MKRALVIVALLWSVVPAVWLPGASARSQSVQYSFATVNVDFPAFQEDFFGCAATGISDPGLIVGGCNDAQQSNELRGYLYTGRRFEEIDFSRARKAASSDRDVQNALPWRSMYERSEFSMTSAQPSSIVGSMKPIVNGVTPQDINRWGQVTGWYSDGTRLQGFLKRNGTVFALSVPDSNLTEAVGLNDLGQVVGDYRGQDGVFHGFVYYAGAYRTINVPAEPDTGAAGINNLGQVVGCYSSCGRGFLYNPKTSSFVSIDFPDPTRPDGRAQSTQAADINDVGHVVGHYYDGTTVHGFFYDGSEFTSIDAPGAILTDIFRINNFDQIVGSYVAETSPGVFEHFAFVGNRR